MRDRPGEPEEPEGGGPRGPDVPEGPGAGDDPDETGRVDGPENADRPGSAAVADDPFAATADNLDEDVDWKELLRAEGYDVDSFDFDAYGDAGPDPDGLGEVADDRQRPTDAGSWRWTDEISSQDAGAWLGIDAPPDGPKETDWLKRDDRPPPLTSTRSYDWEGWLGRPRSGDQRALDEAVHRDPEGQPERFPHPQGRWTELVNDGGKDADPLRGNNCLDCSLSFLSTWYGEPQVSAPRFLEYEDDWTVDDLTGEAGGTRRAERWLGHELSYSGLEDRGFDQVEQRLREGGHGASAMIINSWRPRGAHAWNAVNHRGDIFWVDTQDATVSTEPIYRAPRLAHVWSIVIDREGNRL